MYIHIYKFNDHSDKCIADQNGKSSLTQEKFSI